jgi:hypothetical protein
MADNPKLGGKALRDQRLQAALRENLKRRKAQARGRAGRETQSDEPDRVLDPVTTSEEKDD